jgi:hypothetical protein
VEKERQDVDVLFCKSIASTGDALIFDVYSWHINLCFGATHHFQKTEAEAILKIFEGA